MQEEYDKKIQRTVLALNQNGLSYLANQQQASEAFDYFKKAQKILISEIQVAEDGKKQQQLLAVTYNNLAIYYKKTHKPKAALTYLKKALELQSLTLADELGTASTHLNICAIYSFIGKHQEALEHAELSIKKADNAKQNKPEDSFYQTACENVIVASKYNQAVELEYLKRLDQALELYRVCLKTAQELGRKSIENNSQQAVSRVEKNLSHNKMHALSMILKKKQNQDKGYYEFMRKNKKNIKNSEEDSILQTRVKRYELYNEKIKRGTQSTEKIGKHKKVLTLPYEMGQESNRQGSLPEIKVKDVNKPKQNQ